MPAQPSFPTDFRAIKSLEGKYKGKTTRPIDLSKLRVKVKPTARKQQEVKTVPMPSPLSVIRTLGGVVANAPQGAYDIATILGPAAVDYFRRSSPSDVVEDVKGGLSSYANYFRENPGEAVTDLIPLAGDAKAFGEMIREASLAREAGDEELARAIESYTLPVVAAGLLPEVGGAVGAAARKLRGAKAAPLAVKNEVKALPAPQKTLALPKPPRSLSPQDYLDLTEAADVKLSGPAARAVTDFVGHEPETYAKRLGTGVGVMSPGRLERAFAVAPESDDLAVQQYLRETFAPIRESLSAISGPAIKLYRHQGPTSYFNDEPAARNVLSWTAQPEVAEAFAGLRDVPRDLDIITEDAIKQAEESIAREGRAAAGGWSFVRNPEYPEYVDLYKNGEYITDTDDIRTFLEDENRYYQETNARLEAERKQKRENIVEAYVPLDDIVWATNRAGQHEFIVRNRPGAPYAIDKKGRLGGSEFNRGGLAVKRKKK